jgi:hypothetical protein
MVHPKEGARVINLLSKRGAGCVSKMFADQALSFPPRSLKETADVFFDEILEPDTQREESR